jgi:hypothetical protein
MPLAAIIPHTMTLFCRREFNTMISTSISVPFWNTGTQKLLVSVFGKWLAVNILLGGIIWLQSMGIRNGSRLFDIINRSRSTMI